jgi:hypothetical protein
MPVLHKPKYPVVDPDPSFGRIVANFNLTDLAAVGAFTASGFAFGFLGGRQKISTIAIIHHEKSNKNIFFPLYDRINFSEKAVSFCQRKVPWRHRSPRWRFLRFTK